MSNRSLGGHPMFYQKRRENEQLYSDKHYQYATDADPMSNFRLCGQLIHKLLKPNVNPTIAAALTLMSKQIVGVYEIVGEGKENTVESLEDKLRDIEIYATIMQILVDETKPTDPEPHPAGNVVAITTHYRDAVIDGPYCDFCEQAADFVSDDNSRYVCANCACEKGINTCEMGILEQVG